MTGVSLTTIKSIIHTAGVYSSQDYKKLAAKAKKNGSVIHWTHLRLISQKIGSPEMKSVRKEVEAAMVKEIYTEDELRTLIESKVPKVQCERLASADRYMKSVTSTGKSVAVGRSIDAIVAVNEKFDMLLKALNEVSRGLHKMSNAEILSIIQQLNSVDYALQGVEKLSQKARHLVSLIRLDTDNRFKAVGNKPVKKKQR